MRIDMDSRSVSYTAEFKINQTIQSIFPLFSPEGERLWVPGWKYENIMGTTHLQEDDVFMTKSHDHAANEAIWIVKKYDPKAYRVQYYKIEPKEKVGIVTVKCNRIDPLSTKVEITYKYIGLSDNGNLFIEHFTKKDYEDFIEEWKNLLETYFQKKANTSKDGQQTQQSSNIKREEN
jgi:hypothetical protein